MSESNGMYLLFVSEAPVKEAIGESINGDPPEALFVMMLVAEWAICLAVFWLMGF